VARPSSSLGASAPDRDGRNDMKLTYPSRPHILCVDNDAAFRMQLTAELARAGFAVTCAGTARAALAIARHRRPDLILCSLSAPASGGFELLEALRAAEGRLAATPFIFLADAAGRDELLLGKQLGVDDYVAKPVDYELLLATIGSRLSQIGRVRLAALAENDAEGQSQTGLTSELDRQVTALQLRHLGIGLMVVARDRQIFTADPIAEHLLEEGDGLCRHAGRLASPSAKTAKALREALRGIDRIPNQSVVVARRDRQPLLLLLSRTYDAHALITITAPERPPLLSENTVAALYGLTPMEAKVSIAIASGKRPDEICASLHIAQSTINFHLNNVFRKTGTSRQVDLATLVMRTALAAG
jgi:DNA-binding NarL/FixJ family response regulator